MSRILCLILSLALGAALSAPALSAPAPFPKNRDSDSPPSTERVKHHLTQRGLQVGTIEARAAGEWHVVAGVGEWGDGSMRSTTKVFLVRYTGKDSNGTPRFTLTETVPLHRRFPPGFIPLRRMKGKFHS
jgi:hypothetical protein